MPRTTHAFLFLILLALLAGACQHAPAPKASAPPIPTPQAESITFAGLLEEMTDLEALARMPEPAWKGVQFSSYDRASTSPLVATDAGWFANRDIGHYIRQETRADGQVEYVAAEIEGPGALVRFWSANANGIIRIYLDNPTTPTLEMPVRDFMRGDVAPWLKPLAGVHGLGWNNYVPIPFARYCKVSFTQELTFYHINARLYPPETRVETWHPEQADKHQDLLNATRRRLENPQTPPPLPEAETHASALILTPGSSESWTLKGPMAIRTLTCQTRARDTEKALRSAILTITFDNQVRPAVCAPLSDFFGVGFGTNPYQSLPLGRLHDGAMYCHYVMPFQKNARITLTNHGTEILEADFEYQTTPWIWQEKDLYFHAQWQTRKNIPTIPRQDISILHASGKGRYAGTVLHIRNPIVSWWGEGDEKIYIDGETFPSTFGTGTEDYFGYAWCWYETFTHAFHNQVRCDGPGNFGNTVLSRFHMLDALPFQQSIRFDMELYHHLETVIDWASLAIWYADGSSQSNIDRPQPATLLPKPLPKHRKAPDAIEGEDLQVLFASDGYVSDRFISTGLKSIKPDLRYIYTYPALMINWTGGAQWSNGRCLWWHYVPFGARLDLAFQAPRAGKYDLYLTTMRSSMSGRVAVSINGTRSPEICELRHHKEVYSGEIHLGAFLLSEGDNTISFELLDETPASSPPHRFFALDYLRLAPTRR